MSVIKIKENQYTTTRNVIYFYALIVLIKGVVPSHRTLQKMLHGQQLLLYLRIIYFLYALQFHQIKIPSCSIESLPHFCISKCSVSYARTNELRLNSMGSMTNQYRSKFSDLVVEMHRVIYQHWNNQR